MNKAGAYAMCPEGNPDELVNQFLYLVKRIAHHMIARLPSHIEVEDLIQVGLIGLLDAGKNYNPSLGASFETYATLRIRGSMIDDLRRNDWVPRTVQLKMRQLSKATQETEAILQRAATDTEIAEHMSMDIHNYHAMLDETTGCRITQFDTEDFPADADHNPYQDLEAQDFHAALAAKIDHLPEREKLVMSLYYEEDLNLKEIGLVLDVSESRVSQIHSQAVARLRAQLSSWLEPAINKSN